MINGELLAKFDSIHDLPVSEELLGAFVEGGIDDSEQMLIAFVADNSHELYTLICDNYIETESVEPCSIYEDSSVIGYYDQELPTIPSREVNEITNGDVISPSSCTLENICHLHSLDSLLPDNLMVDSENISENDNFLITDDRFDVGIQSLESNTDLDLNSNFDSEECDFNNVNL